MKDLSVRYGKLENGILKYAPRSLDVGGATKANPTRDDYLAAGYKPVVAQSAPVGLPRVKGQRYVRDGWIDKPAAIVTKWKAVKDATPARKWSRLSVKTALAVAGKLPEAEAFLSSVEVAPDYSAWQALTDCDYIEEGYGGQEKWNAVLDGAAQALGKTRAEIDAFLAQIPHES